MPYSLPIGMRSTLCGLLLLAFAPSFAPVLLAAAFVGLGSAVFHPESSRIARFASGGRHGFAQSLFQVGGNTGTPSGRCWLRVIVPYGQRSVAWFALIALLGIAAALAGEPLVRAQRVAQGRAKAAAAGIALRPPHHGVGAIAVLLVLIFSKYFYIAGLSSFYTFYLIEKFGLSVQQRAAPPVHLPVRVRARHDGRRAGRRPHRPQARDLVLDPGRRAVRAAAAARRPVLDHGA